MNKKYLISYIFLICATFLFTYSLTTFDHTIKYRSEIAMKKVEEARKTKDKKVIEEAKDLIEDVISDNVKAELEKSIADLEIEIDKDLIRAEYNTKLDEVEESLDEVMLNDEKTLISKLKYEDIKTELNERVKSIEDKIAAKKAEEEERRRQEEEAARARQNAYNKLVNADNEAVYSNPPANTQVLETVSGTITAFTAYCSDGCHGYVASGMYVGEGNIHYYDSTYGKVYIVAGGPEYPLGTIVRMKNVDYFGGRDIYAIVLDRGGAIGKGRRALFDLLFALESNANNFGVRYGVTCEILRLGY